MRGWPRSSNGAIVCQLGGIASLWCVAQVGEAVRYDGHRGRGVRACVWEHAPNNLFQLAFSVWTPPERDAWRAAHGALPVNWWEGAEDRAFRSMVSKQVAQDQPGSFVHEGRCKE